MARFSLGLNLMLVTRPEGGLFAVMRHSVLLLWHQRKQEFTT